MPAFVFLNLRRLFGKYPVVRTEHDPLVKSTTKIFSNFVASSETPNFTIKEYLENKWNAPWERFSAHYEPPNYGLWADSYFPLEHFMNYSPIICILTATGMYIHKYNRKLKGIEAKFERERNKDLFIKNRSSSNFTLILFCFEFLWISLYI